MIIIILSIIVLVVITAYILKDNGKGNIIRENTILIEVFNLLSSNADSSHGLDHILQVLQHAKNAMVHENLSVDEKIIIELACLLHDIDDEKYFSTHDYANARRILSNTFPVYANDVITCIKLVSASSNGNSVDPNIPSWMYIPRWADRIEAMGHRGIERTITYNNAKGSPMIVDDTIPVLDRKSLLNVATPDRFAAYASGVKSKSVIDHFYDKLLHLKVETGNVYIDTEMKDRHTIMENYVIDYFATRQ